MRILIVDDDFVSRKILKGILAPLGDCDIAVDGEEAVHAFCLAWEERKPYDLFCLDVMMPNMDGLEALRRIRAMEADRGIPEPDGVKVLMITALGDPGTVFDAFYRGGATAYLVKPISRERVMAEIRGFGLGGK